MEVIHINTNETTKHIDLTRSLPLYNNQLFCLGGYRKNREIQKNTVGCSSKP